MRALRLHAYGQPLRLEAWRAPEPGPGEVRVRNLASSVNPVDWKVRDGLLAERIVLQLPLTLGGDACGIVEQVGEGVTSVAVGDLVFLMTPQTNGFANGGFADEVIAPASALARKPESLTPLHAAAVPQAALTAWQALHERAEIRSGQRVLVHGGGGGVGGFAVQFARAAGAEIYATTSAADAARVRDLGASHVIDYASARFEDEVGDLDAVIDLIGGEIQDRSYAVLRPGGVLVNAWGRLSEDRRGDVRAVKVAVRSDGAQLTAIAALIDDGVVRVNVAATFALEQADAALDLSRRGGVGGKIAIDLA